MCSACKFKKDSDDAKQFENDSLAWIQTKHPTAQLAPKDCPYYDIQVSPTILVECKDDIASKTYNNIAIEYERDGKPTGISITTATWWMIQYWDKNKHLVLLAKTEALREVALQQESKPGGDGKRTRNYLIPINLISTIKDSIIYSTSRIGVRCTEGS